MSIDDFKDTIELDNVSRRVLDMQKDILQEFDGEKLDDITVLRFCILFAFRVGNTTSSDNIPAMIVNALLLAKADPATVEYDLFRNKDSGNAE